MTETNETQIIEIVPPKTEEVKPYVIIASVKTYSLKNGETKTKVYDQRPYNQKYYSKIKETLKEPFICDICNGKYQKWNRGHHLKSKKHINEVNKQ